jgi:hypothetical protein
MAVRRFANIDMPPVSLTESIARQICEFSHPSCKCAQAHGRARCDSVLRIAESIEVRVRHKLKHDRMEQP